MLVLDVDPGAVSWTHFCHVTNHAPKPTRFSDIYPQMLVLDVDPGAVPEAHQTVGHMSDAGLAALAAGCNQLQVRSACFGWLLGACVPAAVPCNQPDDGSACCMAVGWRFEGWCVVLAAPALARTQLQAIFLDYSEPPD